MTQTNAGFMWGSVAIVAVLLQVFCTFWDSKSTVTKTAIEFSKAYFFLESDMEDYLSSDFSSNIVSDYIFSAYERASKLGLDPKNTRRSLEHIKTEITDCTCDSAKVRVTALSRTYLNPLFAWVSKLFNLGRLYRVDEMLDLVKENGDWKISGSPFRLCSVS